MAENKKSFVLYADLITTVEKLSDEEAGKLMKHLLRYVNDLNPVADRITELVFEQLKNQLKRDLQSWEETRQKRVEIGRIGGIKSGESRRTKQTKQNKPIASNTKQNEANEAVTVTVNDNVNVNVTESVIQETHPLKNSNLFRQPKIPTKEEVRRAFFSAGGTEEQAARFFDKYNAVGWFLNGSPIVNFKTLLPSYISNWTENEKNKKNGTDKRTPEKYSNPKTAGAERALDQLKDILSSTGFGAANPES